MDKMEKTTSALTMKDLDYAHFRWWLLAEVSVNYERMQGIAYCASMAPVLRKIYQDKEDEELRAALKQHLAFFNTEATWGALIFGSVIAMEEQRANDPSIPPELITSYKTGLMGTLAGIGDTIDLATIYTLVSAACASLAVDGSILAPILMIVLGTLMYFEGHFFNRFGYKYGKTSVRNILASGLLQDVVEGANIVGLFMIGCLSAGLITLSTTFTLGSFNLQETLDTILPGILPISMFFLVYLLMTKSKLSASKIVLILIVGSVIGSLLGIF